MGIKIPNELQDVIFLYYHLTSPLIIILSTFVIEQFNQND